VSWLGFRATHVAEQSRFSLILLQPRSGIESISPLTIVPKGTYDPVEVNRASLASVAGWWYDAAAGKKSWHKESDMEEYRFHYGAEVLHVVDGDTIDLKVDLGFRIYRELRVRLYGLDAPETFGVKKDSAEYAAGKKAADYLRSRIEGKWVVVRTHKDATEKFGRYLATVYLDGVNINQELLDQGYAVPLE